MKGLLIKDFKLLKQQKNFFIVIILMSIIATITSSNSISFGFLGFLGITFSLSSISYDEFDNGNVFLFSLPITRKDYVLEKYFFGMLIGSSFLLMATTVSIISIIVKNNIQNFNEIFVTTGVTFCVILLFLSIMLPIILKYGNEKGRIVGIIIMGISSMVIVLIGKIFQFMKVDLVPIIDQISKSITKAYLIWFLLFSFIFVSISYFISISIMKKKQF